MGSLLETLLTGLGASIFTVFISMATRYFMSTHPPKKREIMIRSRKTGDSIRLEVGPGPMTAEQHEALRQAMDELTRRDSANRPATA